ncbi:MAG: HU family DNA-binding protein [Candidatus Halalkalibacterium sp. M3_1C_030]
MNQKIIGAFSEILREEITNRNEVSVEGLGVFKPDHKKQYQKQFDDGRVVMMPPKDKITFVADKKFMNDSE